MCLSAVAWARVDKIVYGTRIKDAQNYGFNEITISNKKMKELGQIDISIIEDFMREECLQVFEIWKERGGEGY